MGPGPFYLFYRPYHLGHFEAMKTVAWAVLDHRPVLKPAFGYRTNVHAYAKVDLRKGDELDGIGGYAAYGLIENLDDPDVVPGAHLHAEHMTLKRDVAQDERLAWEDVDYDRAIRHLAVSRGRGGGPCRRRWPRGAHRRWLSVSAGAGPLCRLA
jgi:predicted homoserine dehydrogenase-like protein